MAYTTVNKSTDYFNTKLFVGNSSTNAITGVGHQPDWTWIKRRDGGNGYSNFLFDAVRGVNKGISSNQTAAEITFTNGFDSFNSDGFTLGANTSNPSATELNDSGGNYASWNWKANGAGSANTDGYINSTVSVNTTAGFSIVKYTGTGSVSTIGHGLGVAPKMIITKNISRSDAWPVDARINAGGIYYLNQTDAAGGYGNSSPYPTTAPTNLVYSVGTAGNTNYSGSNLIAYCFAEKTGYSKFGSYTGLGGTNYPFIYTGFKPAFVMVKRTNATSNWVMYDNKRQYNNIEGQYNPQRPRLASNTSNAESSFTSDNGVDLLSNGFVARDNSSDAYTINISGGNYIYMAFGQSLVGSNNVPCTAR